MLADYKKSRDNAAVITLINQLPAANPGIMPSYSFQESTSEWVNIDSYLHLLNKGSKTVIMALKGSEGTTEIYQWLNTINNLTPLNLYKDTARAYFPLVNTPEARVMEKTFCFAISRKNGIYKWFDQCYNPYETKSVNIDFKPSTLSQIKSILQAYGVKQDLDKRLNDLETRTNEMLSVDYRNNNIYNAPKLKEVRKKLDLLTFPCAKKQESLNR